MESVVPITFQIILAFLNIKFRYQIELNQSAWDSIQSIQLNKPLGRIISNHNDGSDAATSTRRLSWASSLIHFMLAIPNQNNICVARNWLSFDLNVYILIDKLNLAFVACSFQWISFHDDPFHPNRCLASYWFSENWRMHETSNIEPSKWINGTKYVLSYTSTTILNIYNYLIYFIWILYHCRWCLIFENFNKPPNKCPIKSSMEIDSDGGGSITLICATCYGHSYMR